MNIAKVAMRYTVEHTDGPTDIQGVITFHVRRSDGEGEWTELDLEELGGRVQKWWSETADLPEDHVPLRYWYSNLFRLDGIDCRQVSPSVSDIVEFPAPDPPDDHGSGLGTMLAPQLALIIGLRSDTDTRRGRGRIYLPAFWPGTAAVPTREGFVPDEVRLLLARLGADLVQRIEHDPLELTNWALVVYSRVDDAANAVLSFSIPDRVATQRRRRAAAVQHPHDISGDPIV